METSPNELSVEPTAQVESPVDSQEQYTNVMGQEWESALKELERQEVEAAVISREEPAQLSNRKDFGNAKAALVALGALFIAGNTGCQYNPNAPEGQRFGTTITVQDDPRTSIGAVIGQMNKQARLDADRRGGTYEQVHYDNRSVQINITKKGPKITGGSRSKGTYNIRKN